VALDEASKKQFNTLLFQLGELLNDPPVVIGLYGWMDDVDEVMEKIQKLSPEAYDRLEDLVSEAVQRANQHVSDIDAEADPKVLEHDSNLYFEEIAFVSSEINNLKIL